MDVDLRYAPFVSNVDVGFWHQFTKRKVIKIIDLSKLK